MKARRWLITALVVAGLAQGCHTVPRTVADACLVLEANRVTLEGHYRKTLDGAQVTSAQVAHDEALMDANAALAREVVAWVQSHREK